MLINEVPDIQADAQVGKRTLPVRLGINGVRVLYLWIHVLALVAIGLAIAMGILPVLSITLPGLLLLVAVFAAINIKAAGSQCDALKRSIKLTLAIHGLGSLWLAGWVWYAA